MKIRHPGHYKCVCLSIVCLLAVVCGGCGADDTADSNSKDSNSNLRWIDIESPKDGFKLAEYRPIYTLTGSVSENYIPRDNVATISIYNASMNTYGDVGYTGSSWNGSVRISEGENVLTVVADDSNGSDSDTVTIHVPAVALSDLELDGATFNEDFQNKKYTYISRVCFNVDEIRLKIDVPNEYIQWSSDTGIKSDDGYLAINLAEGENTVNLHVHSPSLINNDFDSEVMYVITIYRSLDTHSTLDDIFLSSGRLDNILDPYQDTINVSLDNVDDSLSLSASATDPCATIRIKDQELAEGVFSDTISIGEGPNLITISVDDGVTDRTYELNANRDARSDYTQSLYIKAQEAIEYKQFGDAIDVEDDLLVVGGPGAHVYVRNEDGRWLFDSKLGGGKDVSISGNRIASSSDELVYIYEQDNENVWQLRAELQASNAEQGDLFGFSIALNGDTLAVGAPREDSPSSGINGDQGNYPNDPYHESGAVYIFDRDSDGNWLQTAYIKASNAGGRDYHTYDMRPDWFGWSVDLDGNTLVAGAENESSCATGINGDQLNNSCRSAGAAYVFIRDTDNEWSQEAYIKSSEGVPRVRGFGSRVAVSNDTIAVSGVPYNVDPWWCENSRHEVHIFVRDINDNWMLKDRLSASNENGSCHYSYHHYAGSQHVSFGSALSLHNDKLLVGSPSEDSLSTAVNGDQANDDVDINAGAAYLFVRDAYGNWVQNEYIKASNTDAGDEFGCGVAISDNVLTVGACNEGSASTGIHGAQSDNSLTRSGAVYIYE